MMRRATWLIPLAFAFALVSCGGSNEALAPPRTTDTGKADILIALRTSPNREEWVARYLERFPGTHPLLIIGDYNSDSDFTKRWKLFSLAEMQTLVEKNRKAKPK